MAAGKASRYCRPVGDLFAQRLAACVRIAARQHGAISRGQVFRTGLSTDAIDRLIASRAWSVAHPGVYVLWQPTDGWRRRLSAAALWLADQGAASHRSSGMLFGLDGIDRAPIELSTRGRRGSTSRGLIIHRVRSLPESEITVWDGIRTTTVPRTLVDLAPILDDEPLELAFESGVRRGLCTFDDVEEAIELSPSNSRARTVLAEVVRAASGETDSALEALLWRGFRTSRLPRPVPQYEVRDASGRFVAQVDYAFVGAKLAVEADGFAVHANSLAFRKDRARDNALRRAGWRVYRTTWAEVARRSERVIDEIAAWLADPLSRFEGAVPI